MAGTVSKALLLKGDDGRNVISDISLLETGTKEVYDDAKEGGNYSEIDNPGDYKVGMVEGGNVQKTADGKFGFDGPEDRSPSALEGRVTGAERTTINIKTADKAPFEGPLASEGAVDNVVLAESEGDASSLAQANLQRQEQQAQEQEETRKAAQQAENDRREARRQEAEGAAETATPTATRSTKRTSKS